MSRLERRRLYILAVVGVSLLLAALVLSFYASYTHTVTLNKSLTLGPGLHHGVAYELLGVKAIEGVKRIRVVLYSLCGSPIDVSVAGFRGAYRSYRGVVLELNLTPLNALVVHGNCSMFLRASIVRVVAPHLWASLVALVLFAAGTVVLTFAVILLYILP